MKEFFFGGTGGSEGGEGAARMLPAREQIIRLMPVGPASGAGYIWQRVFLKGRPQRH
ncbi:MAG: hypothetical protein WC969_02730 [Elusimicrobiota bacterium]|jgi:hypothetical protein